MTLPDYTDNWQRYWQQVADGSRRRQVELAAGDPLGRWLVADAPALVEDPVDIDPDHVRDDPDELLAAARDGFAAHVEDADLARHSDERYGYDVLPIHLRAVTRLPGRTGDFEDPYTDANTLVTIHNATVESGPTREHEAAVVTYQCPQGHETTIRTPLLRRWQIEACGASQCSNDVVPDDTRTRARPVVRFTVDTVAGPLPCVVTGQYAAVTDEFERLANASRLHLTAIPRLVTGASGALDPTLEVVAVEPA